LPKKGRWVWLLISSYLFCIYANLESAIALLLVTIISFACGFLIGKTEEKEVQKGLFNIGHFPGSTPIICSKIPEFLFTCE
jgi:hypothetical protein